MDVIEERTAPTGIELGEVEGELRPSLVRTYSKRTLDCYRRRLTHYSRWCLTVGYQPGPEHITTQKLLEYVRAQIKRWSDSGEPSPPDYRRLRPETIKQAINALVYYGERSAPATPDDREAKELLRCFKQRFNASVPPAWRVMGRRRSPRPSRQQVARPPLEPPQPQLFDVDE